MDICIVTGASSGMGREFVLQLDAQQKYDEIWVLARRADRLMELSQQVSAKLVPMTADLSTEEGLSVLTERLQTEKPKVKTLVNAAGYGKFGAFETLSLQDQLGMIDLNVKALTAVTYEVLPYLQKGSEVYELGSLSSFQPVPYIGVYGATKAYVLSFSRAINVELKKHGIRVMAVCPGWVKTEFFNRAIQDDTITYFNRYYPAQQVVKRALRDMKKKKDVSTVGFPVRMQIRLVKLLPHRLVMKIWCKQQGK